MSWISPDIPLRGAVPSDGTSFPEVLLGEIGRGGMGVVYNVAYLYAIEGMKIEGMKDEAMTYLDKAVDIGFAQKSWVENDDDLNSRHDMPRFKALLAKMK